MQAPFFCGGPGPGLGTTVFLFPLFKGGRTAAHERLVTINTGFRRPRLAVRGKALAGQGGWRWPGFPFSLQVQQGRKSFPGGESFPEEPV